MSLQQILELIPQWVECPRVEDQEIVSFLVLGIVLGFVVAIVLTLILSIISKKKQFKGIGLFRPFAIVWILGFAIYDIGMSTGEPWSLLTNTPMAILHAFGMFVLESDVSALHDRFHNHGLFMFCFSSVHFAAAAISLWFVIKHFGFNIVAAIKRFFAKSQFGGSRDTTYIFWGMNNATYHLAKSINAHHLNDKTSYRIIIIRSNKDVNSHNSRSGLERLFDFFSSNDQEIEKMREIEECVFANTFVYLPELNVFSLNNSLNVFRALGLKSVSTLIDKKTNGDVHMFFLSEDASANIKAVANLKKDCILADIMKRDTMINGNVKKDENGNTQKRQVKFYCHARHNSINRVIEDLDATNNAEIRIVDTSHLSIECLKRDVRYQPISFVDIDKTKNYGAVLSPFTSLIVGFGETGKDALRFLYEFGAFVDNDTTKGTHRSPFNCHIVDKQLDSIKGAFMNASPRVFAAKNTLQDKDKSEVSPLVSMYSIDYESDDFYNHVLSTLAPTLNYVIIAVGDDEAGMMLAVRILNYMRREGRDFKQLKILVRSYESSLYSHMDKIAKHYNEKEERIVLFGDEKQLYTYSMIIEDEFEQRGRDYYESYRALNPEHDEDGSWKQRRMKLKGWITLKKKQIDPNTGCPIFEEISVANPEPATLNNLQKLRRKETQDKANALHEATKMKILETIIPNWYNQLVPCIFEFVNTGKHIIVRIKRKNLCEENSKKVYYTDLELKDQILMGNLAKLEHLRWNASHEVMGYIPMPADVPNKDRGCDETRKTHNCLINWEDLDAESDKIDYINDYKIFDYGVVETTIDIYRRIKDKETQ